jgi:hypothetical protein
VSAEERDCIEETIEIILAELDEIQVRLQFHPEVAKKISESLKTTAASRRSRVGHIFGVPAASSELTSLVVRVQEKLTEEAIRSIHSNSVAKATKTDQEADFATEHKKLKEENNDTKRELARLKQLCVKNQIDTSTRKQKEEQKGAQRVSKGGRPDKKSTAVSTASPVADDAAAGADTYFPTCPHARCRDATAFRFTRCASGFPAKAQHFWSRASGYFIPQEFVRTSCGGSKKRLLVRSSLASKTGCVCHFTAHTPPCMHLHCLYRTRMSNSSYRTCPKGTAWAPMPRCGLKVPTFSAECAFIRKRAESSEWYTTTVT